MSPTEWVDPNPSTTDVPQGTGGVADVMAAYGTWETRRMPDAVRAAALANAVDLMAPMVGGFIPDDAVAHTLDMARAFEAYLVGEEAHDTP